MLPEQGRGCGAVPAVRGEAGRGSGAVPGLRGRGDAGPGSSEPAPGKMPAAAAAPARFGAFTVWVFSVCPPPPPCASCHRSGNIGWAGRGGTAVLRGCPRGCPPAHPRLLAGDRGLPVPLPAGIRSPGMGSCTPSPIPWIPPAPFLAHPQPWDGLLYPQPHSPGTPSPWDGVLYPQPHFLGTFSPWDGVFHPQPRSLGTPSPVPWVPSAPGMGVSPPAPFPGYPQPHSLHIHSPLRQVLVPSLLPRTPLSPQTLFLSPLPSLLAIR